MILLKPDMPPADLKDKKLVFLAGPIMGAENWQARAAADLADLDVYVADPRREKSENFDYDSQVGWESFYLSRADVVMFWLPLAAAEIKGRSYAQTTRFELGEWLGRTDFNRRPGKTVVIGIEEGFAGKAMSANAAKARRAQCLTLMSRLWRKCAGACRYPAGYFSLPTLISVRSGRGCCRAGRLPRSKK